MGNGSKPKALLDGIEQLSALVRELDQRLGQGPGEHVSRQEVAAAGRELAELSQRLLDQSRFLRDL